MEYAILEYMGSKERARLIRRAGQILARLPVSRRRLARSADVSHSTINRLTEGDPAITYQTVLAVAGGLTEISEGFAKAEKDLRDVLDEWDSLDRGY